MPPLPHPAAYSGGPDGHLPDIGFAQRQGVTTDGRRQCTGEAQHVRLQ